MGNVTISSYPRKAGRESAVSFAGVRRTRIVGTGALSNSYATGGDTLSLPSGLGTLKILTISPEHNGTYYLQWDGGTGTVKIKAYSAFATQVTAATDLSAVTFNFEAVFELG